jgi:hypothetical protein
VRDRDRERERERTKAQPRRSGSSYQLVSN